MLKQWASYFNRPFGTVALPTLRPNTSSLCKQEDFLTEHHQYWCDVLKEKPRFHRKQWELVYILETLKQKGMIGEGKRGLAFAVGTEPIPAVLASMGCLILATDLDTERGAAQGWMNGNQLCFGVDDLNTEGLCDAELFRSRCTYRPVDMNAIPSDLRDFDFNWSTCSFEHLGSIEKGLAFLRNQLATLKPGGWAIHTTEYNVSSNFETLETESCVVFRQRDIEKVISEIRADGHYVAEPDYSLGWMPYDYKIDLPPFTLDPHLRLQLGNFVCTSIGLIIQKRSN